MAQQPSRHSSPSREGISHALVHGWWQRIGCGCFFFPFLTKLQNKLSNICKSSGFLPSSFIREAPHGPGILGHLISQASSPHTQDNLLNVFMPITKTKQLLSCSEPRSTTRRRRRELPGFLCPCYGAAPKDRAHMLAPHARAQGGLHSCHHSALVGLLNAALLPKSLLFQQPRKSS